MLCICYAPATFVQLCALLIIGIPVFCTQADRLCKLTYTAASGACNFLCASNFCMGQIMWLIGSTVCKCCPSTSLWDAEWGGARVDRAAEEEASGAAASPAGAARSHGSHQQVWPHNPITLTPVTLNPLTHNPQGPHHAALACLLITLAPYLHHTLALCPDACSICMHLL